MAIPQILTRNSSRVYPGNFSKDLFRNSEIPGISTGFFNFRNLLAHSSSGFFGNLSRYSFWNVFRNSCGNSSTDSSGNSFYKDSFGNFYWDTFENSTRDFFGNASSRLIGNYVSLSFKNFSGKPSREPSRNSLQNYFRKWFWNSSWVSLAYSCRDYFGIFSSDLLRNSCRDSLEYSPVDSSKNTSIVSRDSIEVLISSDSFAKFLQWLFWESLPSRLFLRISFGNSSNLKILPEIQSFFQRFLLEFFREVLLQSGFSFRYSIAYLLQGFWNFSRRPLVNSIIDPSSCASFVIFFKDSFRNSFGALILQILFQITPKIPSVMYPRLFSEISSGILDVIPPLIIS